MPAPLAKDLLLLGGGHSHVVLLRRLGMRPVPGLRVTLLSPDWLTPYSGMLPGLVAGHYAEAEMHIDLAPLCRFAGAALVRGEATGLDTARQQALCGDRPPLGYDILSIDIGIRPRVPPGLASPAVLPVKPIGSFLRQWRGFLQGQGLQGQAAGQGRPLDLAVIGAGAGGIELLLAMEHALAERQAGGHRLHCFTDRETILPDFPAGFRRRFARLLAAREVSLHTGFAATQLKGGRLLAADGRRAQVDLAFLVTEAAPHGWLAKTDLAKDRQGFIQVGETLQSLSHPNIFAAGDCAAIQGHPRPKAGVHAVRQGKPLHRNLIRYALGKGLRRHRPQRRFLALVSTGGKAAVAARNGLSAEGAWVWRWKDWIDRRFMRRFQRLPDMPAPAAGPLADAFDQQMQCGGCGSKLGAGLLDEALAEQGLAAQHEDASVLAVPPGKTLLQSVDHFRAFIEDPYLLARIAVCHALGDLHACNGDPAQVHALITLPYARPAITRNILRQLMCGVMEALEEEGAALAGGHTSQGLELSLGFSATGFAEPGRLWSKGGMKPGDALLLAKPLGTGTLFAADMQGRAKGAWLEAALASMMQSSRAAMQTLRGYAVSACTDVTGFGLAGHLTEMLVQSGAGARVKAISLPILPGALDCLHQGIFSSLHEANASAFPVKGALPILHDPQTSGGLLASLPAAEAPACLSALHAAGYAEAALIGEVTQAKGITLV